MPAEGVLLLLFLSCKSLWSPKGFFLIIFKNNQLDKRIYSVYDAILYRNYYPHQFTEFKDHFFYSVDKSALSNIILESNADCNHSVKEDSFPRTNN